VIPNNLELNGIEKKLVTTFNTKKIKNLTDDFTQTSAKIKQANQFLKELYRISSQISKYYQQMDEVSDVLLKHLGILSESIPQKDISYEVFSQATVNV